MKTTKILTLSALALALAALSASMVAAQPGHHGRRFGGFHDGPLGEFMMERIADRLDLSDEQRTELSAIREVYRPEAELLGETLRVARKQLDDQILADGFDESAIREAAERSATVHADLAVLRARIHTEVLQVLTEDQIAEAREMREKFRSFAEEWRGDRRGRRGPERSSTEGD